MRYYISVNPFKGILLYQVIFVIGMQIFIPPGTFIALTTPTFMKLYGGWQGIVFHFVIIYFAEHFSFMLTYFLGRNIWKIGHILSRNIKYFDVFNNILRVKGAKIIFLLRLCLIIPYDVINYIVSTTDIPLFDYFIGNHGMVMDFIVSTYIGVSVSKADWLNINNKYEQRNKPKRYWILRLLSNCASILPIIFYKYNFIDNSEQSTYLNRSWDNLKNRFGLVT